MFVLALCFLTSLVPIAYGGRGCIIDVTSPAPLVLSAYTYNFYYPPVNHDFSNFDIILPAGETILIACPHGQLNLDFHPSAVYATCNDKSRLVIDDQIVNYFDLQCTNTRFDTAHYTRLPCGKNSEIIEIGFEIGNHIKFIPTLTVCFDNVLKIAKYVNHTISMGSFDREFPENREQIIEDNEAFELEDEEVSLDKLYDPITLGATINSLLGYSSTSNHFRQQEIKRDLIANHNNFFYNVEGNVTYHGINTWAQFPKPVYNNWMDIYSYQKYAHGKKVDLQMYAGTYGIATLPSFGEDKETELYVYFDDGDTEMKAIPIPAVTWQLLYEPVAKKAAGLLTINLPFEQYVKPNIICDDISDSVKWLGDKEKMRNVTMGYSYVCSYENMYKVIPDFPKLDVVGLLL